MYEQKTSHSYLLKENQELKMEITELRNAFNINKQILQILSQNNEVNKRHFYVMLRKLNEYVYDLSEHQMDIRRQKAQKDAKIKQLEEFIEQYEEERKYRQEVQHTNFMKSTTIEKKIIQPKESHFLLMDEIKKMTNEINSLKQDHTKLKSDNLQLRKRIKKLKSCSNCKYDNSTFEQDSSPSEKQYETTVKSSKHSQKITSSTQLQFKIQKLTKANDHLNFTIQLLSNAFRQVSKVKKSSKKQQFTESKDIVIELIKDRIDMDYLDYHGFTVIKQNVRGKSI